MAKFDCNVMYKKVEGDSYTSTYNKLLAHKFIDKYLNLKIDVPSWRNDIRKELNNQASNKLGREVNLFAEKRLLNGIRLVPDMKLFGMIDQINKKPVEITSNDKIIFGHPTIGKSFLKKDGDNRFISLDDDYSADIIEAVDNIAKKYNVTTYQVKDSGDNLWNGEYNSKMQELFNIAKNRALIENKILFTSNTNLLRNNKESFDKVINLSREEFEKRIKERGAKYNVTEWKNQIEEVISTFPKEKVINTSGYLSDLITIQKIVESQNITEKIYNSINQKEGSFIKSDKVDQVQQIINDYNKLNTGKVLSLRQVGTNLANNLIFTEYKVNYLYNNTDQPIEQIEEINYPPHVSTTNFNLKCI